MNNQDRIEQIRRELLVEVNSTAFTLPAGPTWTTAQLQQEFAVKAFRAPFVIVQRRVDGVVGSLEFTHAPRLYFNWEPDQQEQS